MGEMAEHPADDPQPPLPGLDPPRKGTAAIEETIFAAYLAARRKAGTTAHPPRLDEKRRRMIRGRLAEGFTADDVSAAARGIWHSAWHVAEKQTAFDLVVRDAKQVERFRDLDPASQPQEEPEEEWRPPPMELPGGIVVTDEEAEAEAAAIRKQFGYPDG